MKLVSFSILTLIMILSVAGASAQNTLTTSLFGTRWQLLSYGAPDSQLPAIFGVNVTLEFGMASTASGFGGCNSYSTSYTVDEPNIRFDMPMSTLMACVRDDVMNQELFFFQTLQAVNTYEIRENRLILYYAGGQMVFAKLDIVNTEWELVSYGDVNNPTTPIGNIPITAKFEGDGIIAGFTGCNIYGGNYTISHIPDMNTLTFSNMYQTEMACMQNNMMAQESAYMSALVTATRIISQTVDKLVIEYGKNQQLVFERRYMLENTSWKLVAQSAQSIPTVIKGDVNLTFGENMQVSGFGGCNTYGATYTIHGNRISFSDVVSTLMACMDEHIATQETSFFGALNFATRIAVVDDTLILYSGDTTSTILTFERIISE